MTVEAGLTLAEAQAVAERVDRHFPLSLPSEGSCQIGGNLATNAGGAGVLAYGPARQLVLGLEVVLADGHIWSGLRALKKDNSGYDLKDLFIGSEGTLGVITAAVLKLFPKPGQKATGFVALGRPRRRARTFQSGPGYGGAGPHRLRVHAAHRPRVRPQARRRHTRPVRRYPSLVCPARDIRNESAWHGRAAADRRPGEGRRSGHPR